MPFDINDTVPIGVNIASNGTYNIALANLDGLFENQDIYLEDTTLNIIHDLKQSPYSFTSSVGTFDTRFILRYTNSALTTQSYTATKALAFIKDNKLEIQASSSIKLIELFDISGKLIKTYSPATMKNNFESDFSFANGSYVVKVKLEDDSIFIDKLLN